MKKKLSPLILFSVIFFKLTLAQTIHVDTTRHTQGTTEVIVYSSDKGTSHSSHTGHDKNIVKVGLLYWGSGVIPAYYERQVNKWLSIQAGVGLTTRDFVADVVNLVLSKGVNDYQDSYATYLHRKSLVGFYLSAQPKFYVQSDAMDGFWISPMVEFKRYNYKAQMVAENQSELIYLPGTYMNEHRNALDFTVNFGWQWMYNPLVVEFYMGGGFRRFWEVRQDISAINVGNGNQSYVNGALSYGGFRPEFNFCLNFGGFF